MKNFFEKFAFVAQTSLLFLYYAQGPRDINVESTRSLLCGAQAPRSVKIQDGVAGAKTLFSRKYMAGIFRIRFLVYSTLFATGRFKGDSGK
jgi:hypothetical protein